MVQYLLGFVLQLFLSQSLNFCCSRARVDLVGRQEFSAEKKCSRIREGQRRDCLFLSPSLILLNHPAIGVTEITFARAPFFRVNTLTLELATNFLTLFSLCLGLSRCFSSSSIRLKVLVRCALLPFTLLARRELHNVSSSCSLYYPPVPYPRLAKLAFLICVVSLRGFLLTTFVIEASIHSRLGMMSRTRRLRFLLHSARFCPEFLHKMRIGSWLFFSSREPNRARR